jgi:hypothetical protein
MYGRGKGSQKYQPKQLETAADLWTIFYYVGLLQTNRNK